MSFALVYVGILARVIGPFEDRARTHGEIAVATSAFIGALVMTVVLSGALLVSWMMRRRLSGAVPEGRRLPNSRSLPWRRGAVWWLGVLALMTVAGIAGLFYVAEVHGASTGSAEAVATASFFGAVLVGIGLLGWLVISLAVRSSERGPEMRAPAYVNGPDVPPEPFPYMNAKMGSPIAAMIIGGGLALAGVGLMIYAIIDNRKTGAWVVVVPIMLMWTGVGGFGLWIGIARAIWANHYKRIVGVSPWSSEADALRARGMN